MTIDHDALAATVRRRRKVGAIGLLPELPAAYLDLYDEVKRLRAERPYIVGWNAGWDEAQYQAAHGRPSDGDITPKYEFTSAEMAAVEAERDRVAAEWAETSQRNYQRAKAAEARVAKMVEAYDATNPLRTADMHHADCKCLRCEVDDARAALKGDSDE